MAVQQKETWSLRDIVVLGAIAVVFGFLFLQWVPVWLSVRAFGPLAQELAFGFWFIGGILSAIVIRKPGAAIAGEFAAALAEVIFGSPVGVPLLITGLVQGIGAEAVFALYRYQRYSPAVVMLAGAVTAVVAIPWNWWRLAYFTLAPGLQVALLAARVVSGVILGGLISYFLAEALLRTGVLANLAIGRARAK